MKELIAERGKAMVIQAVSTLPDEDDSADPSSDAGNQFLRDDRLRVADWPEGKDWERSSLMVFNHS
jgi:hypothetical protein